jgi:signal peptidase II
MKTISSHKIVNYLPALLLFILDQVTKIWAVKYLVTIIPVFTFLDFIKLDLELAFNQGVSWGLFSAYNLISRLSLIAVILVILIYLILYTRHKLRAGKIILGESLIIAGAISNLIDRLYYGAVIDFIHVSFKFNYLNNLSWDFPIFNLADMGIFIGVCYMLFREYYPEKK